MNKDKMKYDYGKCYTCGEPMEEKRIKQDFWIKGTLIVMKRCRQVFVLSAERKSLRQMSDGSLPLS